MARAVTAFAIPTSLVRSAGPALPVDAVAVAVDAALIPGDHPRLFRIMGLSPGLSYSVCVCPFDSLARELYALCFSSMMV